MQKIVLSDHQMDRRHIVRTGVIVTAIGLGTITAIPIWEITPILPDGHPLLLGMGLVQLAIAFVIVLSGLTLLRKDSLIIVRIRSD